MKRSKRYKTFYIKDILHPIAWRARNLRSRMGGRGWYELTDEDCTGRFTLVVED